MTPVFVATLITGWILVSFLTCLAVCMASSRFSARVEEQQGKGDYTSLRPVQARRARQPIAVRMARSASRVKVKVG